MGECVRREMGEVVMVDTDDQGVGWGKYLRVRVEIDITEPLPRGKKIKLGGRSIWVYFKYERLPLFCYGCGRLWHGGGECPVNNKSLGGVHSRMDQFGPWLWATNGLIGSKEGIQKASVEHKAQSNMGGSPVQCYGESSASASGAVDGGARWCEQCMVVTRDLSLESNKKEVEVAQYLRSQHMEIVCLQDSLEILLNPNVLLEVNVAQEVGACKDLGIQSDLLGPIGPEGNIGVAKVCTEPTSQVNWLGLMGLWGL